MIINEEKLRRIISEEINLFEAANPFSRMGKDDCLKNLNYYSAIANGSGNDMFGDSYSEEEIERAKEYVGLINKRLEYLRKEEEKRNQRKLYGAPKKISKEQKKISDIIDRSFGQELFGDNPTDAEREEARKELAVIAAKKKKSNKK